MLDFREELESIINAWNSDHPKSRIDTAISNNGATVSFAQFAAPILRDAVEAQFSDGT